MRGYPKYINCKQDFVDLLSLDKFKNQALEDLEKLLDYEETVVEVVSGSEEEGNLVTKDISNPMPKWKIIGFADVKELNKLIGDNSNVQPNSI